MWEFEGVVGILLVAAVFSPSCLIRLFSFTHTHFFLIHPPPPLPPPSLTLQDPLNHLQVELLKKYRAGQKDERTLRAIHLSINGLAAGLKSSG